MELVEANNYISFLKPLLQYNENKIIEKSANRLLFMALHFMF